MHAKKNSQHPGRRRGLGAALAIGIATTAFSVAASPAQAGGGHKGPQQPQLSTRSVPIITVAGLQFRDLDRDGALTPFEDWRLSPAARANDLVGRLNLEQKAGLLVHGTLPTTATGYDMSLLTPLVATSHVSTFITRLSAAPADLATANNSVQELAEQQPFAIPVVISTDPRNGFSVTAGQTVGRVGTTAMPDAIGLGATGDPKLTEMLSDIVRQEYRAVGITEALSPQADIATEPRWTRINGTFGADPQEVKRQVQAYIEGLQAGDDGLGTSSVATVVKHWVGYGAQDQGFDSHYYYGRYATFPGNNFAQHLVPFEGAFKADTAGVMPTYSILKDLVYKGTAVPQVGAGFNKFLLTDLLRGDYGFKGVITSDWAITQTCPQACLDNRPPAFFVLPGGFGMPWGLEGAQVVERYAASINAGVDQIGGSDTPSYVVDAVQGGLITEARVNESAIRVLTQKFQLGLFENPYVDAAAAAGASGTPQFQEVGDQAQAKSLTLLTNKSNLLPVSKRKVHTVYLSGVAAAAAEARGLAVTTDPGAADLAIVRLSDPRGGPDLTDLDFKGAEADYATFQAAVNTGVPTVAVPKLDRPLILTNVVDRAAAVVGNYGVSDEVLLETLFGDRQPGGRLPFELPSSMAAVNAQLGDVPDDSAQPLFKHGFGLHYRGNSHHNR